MVRIVVDDGDTVAALDLESPVHSLKVLQCRGNDRRLDAHVASCGERGRGVQHVVHAGNAEARYRWVVPPLKRSVKVEPSPAAADFQDRDIGLGGRAERDEPALHPGNQRLHGGIVKTQDRGAVERNLVDE